jgi:flagellar M-ring protein FliF
LRFMDYSMDVGEPVSASLSDILKENAMIIIKWMFVAIIVGLVMFLGVRPTIQRILPATGTEEEDQALDNATSENTVEQSEGQAVSPSTNADDDELVDISSVAGGVRKRRIAAVTDMVNNDKPEAVKALRAWISGVN